jgi:hypothetical protein
LANDRRKSCEEHVKSWARICEDEIRSWKGFENFALAKVETSWDSRRRYSRGGWYAGAGGPGISIAMKNYYEVSFNTINVSYEYASFHSHPVIGGFYYTKHNTFLRPAMVVCHEMAHAAQFYADRQLGKRIDRPHGDSFKIPYAKIRSSVFNYLIPKNQKELAEKYSEMLKITNEKQFIEWERGLQIA